MSPRSSRRGRPRFTATLLLLVTFLLGGATGLLLAPLLRPPHPGLPPSLEALHLRPTQRARIEAIIARHGPEIERVLAEVRPRLRAVQERATREIEAELDPRQRERFRRDRPDSPPLHPH